jgi:hypothetical protein
LKKLNVYEINDGLDGVILAKSLKQAIKLLAPHYGYPVCYFLNEIKKTEKGHCWDGDFAVTGKRKVIKRGKYKCVRVIGWCEN